MWAVIDFETTGLDVRHDRIVEYAVAMYNPASKKILATHNNLVNGGNEEIKMQPDAFATHGITMEMLAEWSITYETFIDMMSPVLMKCSHVVAHNGTHYDIPMLQMEYIRQKRAMPEIRRIDTVVDVPWKKSATRSLNYLAADHGFVNPWQHRALPDVLTLIKLLEHYDYEQIEKLASSPSLQIVAVVSFESREKAKLHGFRWDPGCKLWLKTIKEMELENERARCPFDLKIVPT